MGVDHYENFPVASLLCPPRLRPAIRSLYAYARTADDLADEGEASTVERLAALDAFEADLHAAVAGATPSPRWRGVFEPLAETVRRHSLPLPLLTDLLSAFRQDVVQPGFPDRGALLDYCRRSANPVGRLLLCLYEVADDEALRQSDAICSALQLTNLWQDLSVDRRRGRLYVPLADAVHHGVAVDALIQGNDSPRVRPLVADLVAWTRTLMLRGAPLVHRLRGRAGWELRLVVQGGLGILRKIEGKGHDALHQRPLLHWHDAPRLAWQALAMRAAAGRGLGETT